MKNDDTNGTFKTGVVTSVPKVSPSTSASINTNSSINHSMQDFNNYSENQLQNEEDFKERTKIFSHTT